MIGISAGVFIFIGLFVYFIPMMVAMNKNKKQTDAITLLNILVGWTLIGWLVALIWAITND